MAGSHFLGRQMAGQQERVPQTFSNSYLLTRLTLPLHIFAAFHPPSPGFNATHRLSLSSDLPFRPAFKHLQPSSPLAALTTAGRLPFSYTPSPLLPTFFYLLDHSFDLDLIASAGPRELSKLGFDLRCSQLRMSPLRTLFGLTLTANHIEALVSGTH